MTAPGESANGSAAPSGGVGATTTIADWRLAERIAITAATANAPVVGAERGQELRRQLHATVAEADPVVRRVANLGEDLSPSSALVIGRASWVRTNLATLRWLTDPLADRLLRQTSVARAVARRVVAVQIGVVLGYLAARVLGQYEALRPPPPGSPHVEPPGRLLLVGPNLQAAGDLAARDGIDPAELYRGVILHELAHRLQFEGVGWLRGHLRGLLDAYLEEARLDPERVREIARRVPEIVADPSRVGDPKQWLSLVLTPAQLDVLDRAQALMTLLEGHGNAVMEWGAADAGAFDPAQVRELLRRRRGRAFDKMARDALGLSMKAKQYAVGERFVLDVADRHGVDVVNRAWDDPEHLPHTDEFDRPDDWASRVR